MNNKYILLAFSISCVCYVQAQNYIFTQRGNNQRTGAFTNERTLNTSNVNQSGFGKLYSYPVDGQVYAQPLYVPGLNVSGKGKRNVLFIATMHNSIYAYDADSLTAPLWQAGLAPSCKLPDSYFGIYEPYNDIKVEIGMISTPVIDSTTNTLYALTFSKENGNYYHKLYAIDITSGNVKMNSPVTISASTVGTGVQSTNGIVTFDSRQELQRTALVLSNGIIYIIFASYGDINPYHGWVLGYNANNLTQKYVFNTTPNGTQGGIWMSGQGPSVDTNGDLYMITGNGDFNANTGGTDYGDSFIKLHPTQNSLSVTDYFTPFNQSYLDSIDADLGVDAPIIIPNSNMILGSGKEGKLYVIDRTNMGKYNASSCNCDNQILQSFDFYNSSYHSSVAYWENNSGGYIFGWSQNDYLKAFKRNGNAFITTPSSKSTFLSPGGDNMPGGILSVTSNGLIAGTGIVWTNIPLSADSDLVSINGVLRAFDATDLTKELWNSNQNSNRDGCGKFAKFNSPLIVNGKVYQPSFSGQVSVYGLNPPVVFREPDNPAKFLKGLNYRYYDGTFSKVSDFKLLTPINVDSISNFSLSPSSSSDNYALSFQGYINIAKDGLYDFYLNSDDGSNLLIGNTIVADNDGLHGSQEVHGSIQLKAGKHAITVNYFQVTGNADLNVSYAGNGITKMPVPDSVLYRDSVSFDSLNSITKNKGVFLNQNIPNPVYQNSKIEFGVNHPTNVVISLFHIDGTQVKTLFQGNVNDKGSVDVNAGDLVSGVYIYKMTTDNVVLTRFLLVIK